MTSDVRARILNAAVDLLKVSGIKKLAQPQVAKAAGIPQGHLTYYFPKKADLLSAVAQRFGELMGEDFGAFVGEGKRSVKRQGLALAGRLVKDRQRTRMLLGLLVEADAEPKIAASIEQNAALVRTLVAGLMGRGEDDADVDLALATLWGLGLQHLIFARTRSERETDRLVARFGEWLALVAEKKPQATTSR